MNSAHAPLQLRRCISPAGLALTLILLFLPFIGVSCETGLGAINAETSGWDTVVGGKPSVSKTGIFAITAPDTGTFSATERDSSTTPAEEDDLTNASVPVQPLMVLAVLAILAALLFGSILRTMFARALGAGIAAGTAALLIVINQVAATNNLIDRLASGADHTPRSLAAEWVGSRIGFWLTLVALLLTTAYSVLEAAVSRRSGAPMSYPYAPSPYPHPYRESAAQPPYHQPFQPPPDDNQHPGGPAAGSERRSRDGSGDETTRSPSS